jgi:hypothetical protein
MKWTLFSATDVDIAEVIEMEVPVGIAELLTG